MRWLSAHRRAFSRAVSLATSTPVLSALVVVALSTALALPLFAAAVADGVLAAVARIDAKPTLSVFLATGAGPRERDGVERALRATDGVAGLRFIARDAALAALASVEGMGDLVAGLDGNPLPDTFVVTLADADTARASAILERARAMPGVSGAQSDVAWVARLDAIARAVRWGGALLGGLMAIAVVTATFAAARLQAVTHRRAIAVSTLLGATRAWVARPYLYHGLLQGTAAGLGAALIVTAALVGVGLALRPAFPAVADLAPAQAWRWPALGVLSGGFLGWLGAWLATRDLSSPPAAG